MGVERGRERGGERERGGSGGGGGENMFSH